jgi:hypothetical protein
MTPEVNQLIALSREAWLPAIYCPNSLRQSPDADLPSLALVQVRGLPGSYGAFRHIQHAFEYPEALPAWFSCRISTAIDFLPPADRPRFELLQLQYRARGLQTLRKAIDEMHRTGSPPTISLILQILYLFEGDCVGYQAIAAQAHAVVLPWIEQASMDQASAILLTINAMFNDTEMACKVLRKTFLDFEYWLASRLKDFWTYSGSFLPPAPTFIVGQLHESIVQADIVVYNAMVRLRRTLHIRDTVDPVVMHAPEESMIGDLKYSWMATTSLHDIGMLINRAIDLASFGDTENRSNEVTSERYMGAALAFTTLYNIRKYMHESSFNGVDLRESPLIVPRLEQILRQLLSTATAEKRSVWQEPLFWMYFTGAWHGQKVLLQAKRNAFANFRPSAKPAFFDPTWFNTQLAVQAAALGLKKWVDARRLLSRFAFSDIIRPHPRRWYEDVVNGVWMVAIVAVQPIGGLSSPP